MVVTVAEGKRAFLGAQNTRPTTIEMAQATGAEDDGVLWRDHPRALRTRHLFHWRLLPIRREGKPDAIRLDASARQPGYSNGGRSEDTTKRSLTVSARGRARGRSSSASRLISGRPTLVRTPDLAAS